MKIVITGNLGYVGPIVVQHLRRVWPDAELIGIDIGYFAHNLTGTVALPERNLTQQLYADVRDDLSHVVEGADAVVALAAISNDPMGKQFEDVTSEINFHAAISLARSAKAAGTRAFIFASSCSVYGSASDEPRQEDSPLDPLTAYARSKVASEEALAALAGPEFRVTCLRFATACGWSDRLRLDLVLNDFVASALSQRRIEILSDGTPWRPLIDVSDMARAIEWAVERDSASGGSMAIVNTGSNDWNFRVRDLADAVAEILGDTEILVNYNAAPDKRSYRVDFSRFLTLAPYHQPSMSLNGTISCLQMGLRRMSFVDTNFRNSGLIRLHTLRGHVEAARLDTSLRWTGTKDFPGMVAR